MDKNNKAVIVLSFVLTVISITGILIFTYWEEISEWNAKKYEEREQERIAHNQKIEERIVSINKGDVSPDFDYVYYQNKVRKNSEISELSNEFEDDFKENFRDYEKRRAKQDLFDISSKYKLFVHKYKKNEKWIYQVRVVNQLRVKYQRSFYYLGEEVYSKEIGVIEFTLTNDNGSVGLGNGQMM